MKTLYLIRHAKSSWDDPLQADLDRPLNKRGNRDTPRMGKRLKEREIHPDLIISSPAERALSTCKMIADVIGYKRKNIHTDATLYHASEEKILSVIQNLNDKNDEVIIFGHNPGITDFVNMLSREHVITNVPTCGIIAFRIPVTSWRDVAWKKGEVEFIDYPKAK